VPRLTEQEQQEIIRFLEADKPLPDKYRFLLFEEKREVELVWNSKTSEVCSIVLPFQVIEQVDEPRAEKPEQTALQQGLFDERGRQLKGWTNKLIWGDNKLILSSLKNGPLREEIEKQGGLKLIYIDPPFDVGADFSMDIEIGGDTFTKKPNILEEIAYRDTWGKGADSFIAMIYERLALMRDLLAEDGSIYVHCDWRVNTGIKLILEDVFGRNNFQREIGLSTGWALGFKTSANNWIRQHDTIYYYSKCKIDFIFNRQYGEYPVDYTKRARKDENGRLWVDQSLGNISNEKLDAMKKEGRVFETKTGGWRKKQYLDEMEGVLLGDIWTDISPINSQAIENLQYPTQKPEALLERIIKASSNEGDLVADFFCGSGTTAAVAEKLGRKWIACDLGRFAIHTTRKRMIQVQRELKKDSKPYLAFEVLNLGKYERQFFFGVPANIPQEQQEKLLEAKYEKYVDLILEGYSAQRIEGHRLLHGKKAGRFVHVGPLNVPVTKTLVEEVFEECRENIITQVDILGFEFEMGLVPYIKDELRQQGVEIRFRYIPREVFDKRAVVKGQVKFYDVAYMQVKPQINGKTVKIELTNFTTYYTQDDLEELEQSLKRGSSKVVIENGQITKLAKDSNGILKRELLTEKWTDWIDYWAVDFDYESKKEIIRLNENDQVKEVWTGNYIFENLWQSFRTKKNPKIELVTAPHTFAKAGKYKIMVKVVDIVGVDTSHVVELEIK